MRKNNINKNSCNNQINSSHNCNVIRQEVTLKDQKPKYNPPHCRAQNIVLMNFNYAFATSSPPSYPDLHI